MRNRLLTRILSTGVLLSLILSFLYMGTAQADHKAPHQPPHNQHHWPSILIKWNYGAASDTKIGTRFQRSCQSRAANLEIEDSECRHSVAGCDGPGDYRSYRFGNR